MKFGKRDAARWNEPIKSGHMDDAEDTISDQIFSFDVAGPQSERTVLSYNDLLACVSALMQSCEGCQNVSVVGVSRLDRPDTAGCNWSLTLMLDAPGVPAEVYGWAYAQVIAMARSSWNLQ